MAFQLTTSAFRNNRSIPKQYTCDGEDVSPALAWNDPPRQTKSLALIVDDPDAPSGTWVHWVIYDLPPDTRSLSEAIAKERELPNGARQGENDFRQIGYNGPCPPRGSEHRYFFKLYALDRRTGLVPGARKKDLERAMQGHILGQAELIGRFRH